MRLPTLQSLTFIAVALPPLISAAPLTNTTSSPLTIDPDVHCVARNSWITQYFDARDCDAALRVFWDETWVHLSESFEFLAPGEHSVTTLSVAPTPQRWGVGTCTVAVIELAAFNPEELPGLADVARTVFSKTDIATYEKLLDTGRAARLQCLEKFDVEGKGEGEANFMIPTTWAQVGDRKAVGIFIWDTFSFMNTVRFPNNGDGYRYYKNSTSAEDAIGPNVTFPLVTGAAGSTATS